jgi:hypothetical protein
VWSVEQKSTTPVTSPPWLNPAECDRRNDRQQQQDWECDSQMIRIGTDDAEADGPHRDRSGHEPAADRERVSSSGQHRAHPVPSTSCPAGLPGGRDRPQLTSGRSNGKRRSKSGETRRPDGRKGQPAHSEPPVALVG